jgi:2-polyprenyl-3-methyl-5-hydroxy-6-metoxy-1,4-benzoquinol methylase
MNPTSVDWDDYGRKRSPWHQRSLFLHHRLAGRVVDRILKRMPRSLSILDLGCGDGYYLERLREMGFREVLGTDPSGPMVERCRKRGLNARRAALEDMAAAGDRDLVLLIQVLEHLENPGAAMDGIRGLLKPKGLLLLSVPVCDSLLSRYHRSRFGVNRMEQVRGWDDTHRHAFSLRGLKSLLMDHGFRVEQAVHCSNLFPWVGRFGGKKLGGLFQRITLGGRFGDILVVLARRD